MTNFDSIKGMTLEQMATTLYFLVLPFAEELNGGKLTEQDRLDMISKLKGFLQAEVKKPSK